MTFTISLLIQIYYQKNQAQIIHDDDLRHLPAAQTVFYQFL